ncbi:MAG: START domain-containing protein, partial [Deltaproteobacteria bacterium]|nr:START domain-containing protein [Deltaproteobacteria bacterium]
ACPRWIHTCREGRLLKRVNPQESYTYTINEAPWPVSDRDAIVLNTINQESPKGPVRINILGVPDYIPEKKGLVRVKMIKGHWLFTPLEEGMTEVVYQVHNDPGGNLPSWLVNSVVVSQPYHTMVNMRKMVDKEKYKEARYDFIEE